MIIYNVKRRWFSMKADAERYRITEGLPPAATFKLEIVDREGLSALLNALSEPPEEGAPVEAERVGVTTAIVDNAFFVPSRDIPAFLRRDWAGREIEA